MMPFLAKYHWQVLHFNFLGIPGIKNRAIKKTNICVNSAINPHTKQLINVEECAIIIAIGKENPIKLQKMLSPQTSYFLL